MLPDYFNIAPALLHLGEDRRGDYAALHDRGLDGVRVGLAVLQLGAASDLGEHHPAALGERGGDLRSVPTDGAVELDLLRGHVHRRATLDLRTLLTGSRGVREPDRAARRPHF